MNSFLISLLVPVYYEENNIDPLLERVLPLLEKYNYEIIFINDGSKDHTAHKIKLHTEKNNRIKLISFQRNFGHQMALLAGYTFAKGDAVITIDADLQDPPEIIPEMIQSWQQGAKIVYAKREKRDVDSWFKRTSANWFYQFINFLSERPIPQEVGDFRLIDRDVVEFLKNLPEQSPFLRGLVAWSGFTEAYVTFVREKRHSGETHYSLSKMVNFALDGITSLSTKPLRLATYMGFLTASFGFLGIIYAVTGRLFHANGWVTGWTALFVGIMFIGGVQLIGIGIIGEYVGKIYKEVQHRPRYLVSETVNV